MRWKQEEKDNSFRIRSGFLFFPKTINAETRWLEFAKWKETAAGSMFDSGWNEKCWL